MIVEQDADQQPRRVARIERACSEDEDEAAMLVGNLYCRVAIGRPEIWWSCNAAELDHHPRKYVSGSDIQRILFGI